ncbi:MAG: 4'-phosphopantetheinyl transferase family protein [Desulfomonilaceae bacterium]
MIVSKKLGALDAQIFFTGISHALPELSRDNRCQIKRKIASMLIASIIDSDVPDFDIKANFLGRPKLILGNGIELSISFSYSPGKVWAAVAQANINCGIDVAFPSEFFQPYPLERAFSAKELELAQSVHKFSEPEAAGFIWSAKESIVKALGTGYKLCDPLDMSLSWTQNLGDYFQSWFLISPKLKSRLRIFANAPIETLILPEGLGFLSLSGVRAYQSYDRVPGFNTKTVRAIGLRQ